MSFKNVSHCNDMGALALRYKRPPLTAWCRPGGGFGICDSKGKDALTSTKHFLPQKIIEAGGDPWSVRGLVDGYNEHLSVPKKKRKGSRNDGRLARHTDPKDAAYLRANLPAGKTLVILR